VEKRGPEHKIDLKTHKAAMVDWRPFFLVLLAMAKNDGGTGLPCPLPPSFTPIHPKQKVETFHRAPLH
jgi:hypothetical protein